MSTLNYIPLTTDEVNQYRNGHVDSNNQLPEQLVTDGSPCRHCLTDIGKDDPCLLLGYQPFPGMNAYSETGPIFIHADNCERYSDLETPEIIKNREQVMIRGYDKDDRIIEGTGKVIDTKNITEEALEIFTNQHAKYLHVRSVTNNCYFCRVELSV